MGLLWLVGLALAVVVLLATRYVFSATGRSTGRRPGRMDRDGYHDAEHDAWYRG